MADSQEEQPRSAASVILVREGSEGVEVYLLRRHRRASFMASSYVFPGGIADEGEEDARVTALRELFEEGGVLLSQTETEAEQREAWRHALNAEKAEFATTLEGVHLDLDSMHYFAHWITPSVEKRRYSAKFYIAVMPEGQSASPDNSETVDQCWVRPADALERAVQLNLPPPQLRTFVELLEVAGQGIAGIVALAAERARHPHAFLPRARPSDQGLTLLMPWDSEYESQGQGDSLPMPADHPLAWGPSRFVLGEDGGWQHIHGPS